MRKEFGDEEASQLALRFHKSCALVSLVMPSSPRRSVLIMEIRLAPLTRFSNTAESVCHTREQHGNMRACAMFIQSMMSTEGRKPHRGSGPRKRTDFGVPVLIALEACMRVARQVKPVRKRRQTTIHVREMRAPKRTGKQVKKPSRYFVHHRWCDKS